MAIETLPPSTIIIGTLIFGALALLWFLGPKYDENEPKPIEYTVPILGNAIPWMNDRKGFFEWAE